jgi:hypothetical protein
MKKQHYVLSTLTVAMAALLPGMSYANPVDFNAGGIETVNNVTAFDWAPSNIFALNGNQAVVDFFNSQGDCASTATNCQLQVYAQGQLSSFRGLDSNGNQTTLQSGLGTDYEITYQYSFTLEVSGVGLTTFADGSTASTAHFDFVADGANYFNVYFDENLNSSDLQGTGFIDGTNILSASLHPLYNSMTDSHFTTNPNNPGTGDGLVPIGGNLTTGGTPTEWASYETVTGGGTTSTFSLGEMVTGIEDYDTNYFLNGISEMRLTDIVQTLAFQSVDPTLQVQVDADGDGVAETTHNTQDTIGGDYNINGGIWFDDSGVMQAMGPSFLFQSDENSPVVGLPEPSIFALLGLGGLLGGIAVGQRKKKATTTA